jgi:putative acetyltransferase
MPVEQEVILIAAENARSDDATRLIAELVTELDGRYGYEDYCPLNPADVEVPGGAFFIARQAGIAVGCGAVRPYEPGVGEIKRVYVSPSVRGKGVGRALMQALEDFSREAGYLSLVLETGKLQPESMALYEKLGFTQIPCFGLYAKDPMSVCYEKRLD